MTTPISDGAVADPDALTAQGWDALRRRDGRVALPLFERALALRAGDANGWYGLAYARRMAGDTAGHLDALDRCLTLAPGHLLALMMKGDHYAASGDGRSAYAYYRAAVKHAPPAETLAPDLRGEIARAEREVARLAKGFEQSFELSLTKSGADPRKASPRAARAVDLLLGRSEIFLQEPTALYFPELPNRQFFEREEFDWLPALEAQTDAMRDELQGILAADAKAFEPYVKLDTRRPPGFMNDMVGNPSWSAFYLWKGGEVVPEARERCPRTLAALEAVPLSKAPGRTPSVLFSLMRPRSHIPAHTGQLNTRLICHLPLIVPPGCTFRVGSESREWVEGQTLIFDDSIEHEAWNRSDRLRVVLLFEVWRPELSEAERAAVAAMLSSVAGYDNG
ncbi:MAG TPA: aspartyl/asparaginyl beta-hydroxylase domain-containing protein [Caulobacteraceae bacterium]|jgi:aspartyl/asparaginyl beta-hydroxylase (cupin superfamily)|nr:aspartyl/asparaginyl beta-hydroxylase domain-containing protein [Caulobacteraceae bacterium]